MYTLKHTIRLADGRYLDVLEQGRQDGLPLIYLHGVPGSNKDFAHHAELYQRQGIRMVSVNRPGTGASSASDAWDAISFADDLAQVMDRLGVETATVVGFSGGGALWLCLRPPVS